MIFKIFFVNFLWAFFVKLSVFGYGFFNAFLCVFCSNFTGLCMCGFGYVSYYSDPFFLVGVLVWGGGMLMWLWFVNSSIMGCVCQLGEFLVRYIAFLIKW